ncbi:hypothetical protein KKA53_05220 [Candidatus Dependentiae bacterium]|nr:hypothetical protein [Candidatus Dependentiae bacterium]
MAGFPLTGYDPADPIPGIIREIRFAQGVSSSPSKQRKVVLLGNKASTGSETVDTFGSAIVGDDDCIQRFGRKSEIYLGYKSYVSINKSATIHAIAVPEGTGTASRLITFAVGPASKPSAAKISCIGEEVQVPIATGDTFGDVRDAAVAKINEQLDWPMTAVATANPGELRVDAVNAGRRHEWVINSVRASFTVPCTLTVTAAAIVAAATDDDMGNAIDALRGEEIYYQVSGKTNPLAPGLAATAPTPADGGIGEHVAMINDQALPANSKGQQVFFAALGTQGDLTAVASNANVNAVRCKIFHAENNDWTPMMIAAHCAAAHRAKEIAHPGANMTDYGLDEGEVFQIPPPYLAADKPTESEIRADLNNGGTPIDWKSNGQAYFVRSITTRSLNGNFNDYRAREGHIPSAIDYYWETLFIRYFTSKQDFVADDPASGMPPLPNTQYPSALVRLHSKVIDDLINFTGGPVLDPTFQQQMKDTFAVVRLTDGLSARSQPIAVKHNNRACFLIEESSTAY